MGSCMNKLTATSRNTELNLLQQIEQNQQDQSNLEASQEVQFQGAKRLTIFYDQNGSTNTPDLQQIVVQSQQQVEVVQEQHEDKSQQDVKNQEEQEKSQSLSKKDEEEEFQKEKKVEQELQQAVVQQQTSQITIYNRKFSIQGTPAQIIQNSFDDKFTNLIGDIKEKPEWLLQQLGIGYSCKKGLKPESPNQDDFSIYVDGDTSIFGVFDGHGPNGHDVSEFVHKRLIENLLADSQYKKDVQIALKNAFIKTNKEVTSKSREAVDCSLSGCTATVVIRTPEKLYIAHVGDSRAILCQRKTRSQIEAKDLTIDHKPTLKNEKKRIQKSGGEVKRMEGDIPHRVFIKGKPFPGLSMSRAIGDSLAQTIGVIPEPEVKEHIINKEQDAFVLMCSDGVWEFISSKDAAEVIHSYGRSRVQDATESLAQKAWGEWISNEGNTVDDITVISFWISE